MVGKGRQTRRYSTQQRDEAIKVAQKIGNSKAGDRLGIPEGTIGRWRAAYQKNGKLAEVKSDATLVKAGQQRGASEVAKARKASNRVARIYTPSQRAQALEMLQTQGAAETSRKLGMSRFSLYEWQRLHRASERDSSIDSPIAGPDVDKGSERDSKILGEWKQQPGLGPSQIRNQLRRSGFKVSVRTVRMVMQEHGYVTPKVKRVESHDQRYEAVRPNQLWHLDFMQRYINKQRISVLFLVDDFSRYIPGYAIWDEDRSEAVFECFESAVSRHGKPETVMSDGGSAFWSWRGVSRFTRLLEEMSIDQIIAKVPQTNGKLEVLNANAQKELFNQERFFDLGQALARLRAWVSFYNLRRTHHALGGLLVPADRYFGRAGEILAHIEAGRSPEGIGEPISLAERQLDLLRVSSRGGKVEVLLMGERIWPPGVHAVK
jgi:putative transposase